MDARSRHLVRPQLTWRGSPTRRLRKNAPESPLTSTPLERRCAREEAERDVPMHASSPLTTRRRCTTLRLGERERAGAWRRVRRRPTTLYESRCCYSVRAFPIPRAGRTGTRPGCTPAYAGPSHGREDERDTAAEHRRLGRVTRSSPCRQPHPTFRVRPPGRTG